MGKADQECWAEDQEETTIQGLEYEGIFRSVRAVCMGVEEGDRVGMVVKRAAEKRVTKRGQVQDQEVWKTVRVHKPSTLWKMVGALRQTLAWNKELTLKLKLTGKGLHFARETMDVQPQECLDVLQLLLAEVTLGPRLQKADGAQDTVPAMSLQLAQPA